MTEKVEKCGGKTIRYPGDCSYSCVCPAGNSPCTWTVNCQGTIFTGTGLMVQTPGHPHVTLAGDISACAQMLQAAWQRRVIVPPELRGRKIRRRTLKGTPEQIAEALGVKLGRKTAKGRKLPPNTVVIKM